MNDIRCYCLFCHLLIVLSTGMLNRANTIFQRNCPLTMSEVGAKVFVMEIGSKQFQFVRSCSRLDVMIGPLRWVITD